MENIEKIIVNKIIESYFLPNKIRRILLNKCGMNISKSSNVSSNCFFTSNNITVGEGSFINRFCQFNTGLYNESIKIGENCMVAMNVNFCATTHEIGQSNKRARKSYTKPILVKSGCWIGANSVILPGITIESGCIIASGAVVTKDCKPNGLYGGVPAKRIKDLD